MKHKTCPYCKAALDFGERCDCRDKEEAAPVERERPQGNIAMASLTAVSRKVKPDMESVAYG